MDIEFNNSSSLGKWSYLMISLPQGRDAFDQRWLTTVMQGIPPTSRENWRERPCTTSWPAPSTPVSRRPSAQPVPAARRRSFEPFLVILPEVNTSLYKRIKTLADKSYGIHTICSVGSKLSKDLGCDKYIANVALKFSLKLSGTSHVVEGKNLDIIDATHLSPGSSHARTFCVGNGGVCGPILSSVTSLEVGLH